MVFLLCSLTCIFFFWGISSSKKIWNPLSSDPPPPNSSWHLGFLPYVFASFIAWRTLSYYSVPPFIFYVVSHMLLHAWTTWALFYYVDGFIQCSPLHEAIPSSAKNMENTVFYGVGILTPSSCWKCHPLHSKRQLHLQKCEWPPATNVGCSFC
jgi:hypothetical protein